MESLDNGSQREEKLNRLKNDEEAHRLALLAANLPVAEGGATPAAIEDLQTRYFLAKQGREDFENQNNLYSSIL